MLLDHLDMGGCPATPDPSPGVRPMSRILRPLLLAGAVLGGLSSLTVQADTLRIGFQKSASLLTLQKSQSWRPPQHRSGLPEQSPSAR